MKNDALYAAGAVYLKQDLQEAMFSSLPELVMHFSYNVIFLYIWRKGVVVFHLCQTKG